VLALRFPPSPHSAGAGLQRSRFAGMAFAYRQGTHMSQAYQRGSVRRPTDYMIDRARSRERRYDKKETGW
jgi:hypothetical protein